VDWVTVTATAAKDYDIWGQFLIQAKGVGLTVVWSGVVAFIAYKLVDLTIGLRVPEEEEREGLDVTSHGEAAYRMREHPWHYPEIFPSKASSWCRSRAERRAAIRCSCLAMARNARASNERPGRVNHSPLVRRSAPRQRSSRPRSCSWSRTPTIVERSRSAASARRLWVTPGL